MINLHNKKELRKKWALTACLIAFLGSIATPLAALQTQENNATETKQEQTNNDLRNVTLRGEISLQNGEQKIAVSLRDSDVKQVLRMFADKAGMNIVFHESTGGKITLDLVNVTINKAFHMVMEMAELTYVIDEDTLMVASMEAAKELSFTKESMHAVPVKYIEANKVATFLNKNIFTKGRPGLSNSEIVVSNPRENEVLIFGSKLDYNIAKKVIEEIDKPLRITTFKVNHTTPKEMATLICDTWLEDKGTEGDELEENSDGEIVIGGGVIACSLDSEDESQGEMESFKTQGIKIAYFPTQGVVKLYGGTAQQADDMKKFVLDADKKQPQALLEMSIVELNETGMKTIDNTWSVYSRFFSGTIGGNGISTSNAAYPLIFHQGKDIHTFVDPLTGTPVGVSAKWRGPSIISAQINWLIKNGNGRTLATPKLMITNGQESTIDLTSDYISSVTAQYLDNGSITPQVQRTYNIASDEGMKITLTPFISPDGYVSLNITPEYSTQKEKVPGDLGGTAATLLNRRNMELKGIRIKDGETMIIGGLIQQNEQKTTSKAPILGDLPLIGWMFRSAVNENSKSELVIMLTPHIIKDTEDLIDISEVDAL